jgi:hypothetical protein
MRHPDRRARSAGSRTHVAVIALAGILLAACNAAASTTPASTASPTATPFPFPTPWPHMTAPARADDVYLALLADELAIVPNTATTGGPGRDPVKRIEATYEGWPLAIGQYRTAKTLAAVTRWKAGAKPGRGEAPIEFIGLNMLIQWGPIATGVPTKTLTDHQLTVAGLLRDKLDALLSPLASRTTVALPAPAIAGSPAASGGTGSSPAASAASSAAP